MPSHRHLHELVARAKKVDPQDTDKYGEISEEVANFCQKYPLTVFIAIPRNWYISGKDLDKQDFLRYFVWDVINSEAKLNSLPINTKGDIDL